MKQNSAQDLQARVERYFAGCDATAERYEQKNGVIGYRQVPYTLAGLAAAIARSEQSIRKAAEGQGTRAEQRILSDAMRRIARHLSERALMGELAANVALPLLSALGMDGKGEQQEDHRLIVVMDDPEGWSE